MILGIGTDLANIERIQGTLDRFGDRFRNRVFTEVEQGKAERRRDVAGTYAKRWAAKEACSKALGTGLRMGISWKDMSVTNLRTGQPVMLVLGILLICFLSGAQVHRNDNDQNNDHNNTDYKNLI